jgi:hypothetical protein
LYFVAAIGYATLALSNCRARQGGGDFYPLFGAAALSMKTLARSGFPGNLFWINQHQSGGAVVS